MNWSTHYPAFFPPAQTSHSDNNATTNTVQPQLTPTAPHPTIADVGCGFGGLLVALAPLYPTELLLGLELRSQVLSYVHSRVAALRSQHPLPSPDADDATVPAMHYQNISALRTNTMKFLPQFLPPHSLSKLFLCFPDPHFKARKHKARIVSAQLNAEYAYFVRPGGKVYTITDVEELHLWMVRHFEGPEAGEVRELWERVGEEENAGDEAVKVMMDETEEGKKVTRNGGRKFVAVFRRREDPAWDEEVVED